MNDIFIKRLIVELCDSTIRNINDNFRSISFTIEKDRSIKIKIILDIITEKEYDYIDDISAEFEAVQEGDILKDIEITTDINSKVLPFVTYCRG